MTDTDKIRVVLVDDHSKIHLAMAKLLSTVDDINLVAHASNGKEAIQLVRRHEPDVVLMDVVMPGLSGIVATREILKFAPHIKILALSGFTDNQAIRDMLEAGAIGYVQKTSSSHDLSNTIRTAYEGKSVLSAKVMQTLLNDPQEKQPEIDYGFTRREFEVLRYMTEGKTNPDIAEEMTVSVSTIKFHVRNILQKMSVQTRTEAVRQALDNNLI